MIVAGVWSRLFPELRDRDHLVDEEKQPAAT
jgi:hypothetical protein